MDFNKKFDVVVVGGGIAGCAAALQAARCGKKTALIEKCVFLGGLATAGLIYIYLPLCDGNGRQVTFGIAEELLHNSMLLGPGEVPPGWKTEKDAPEPRRFRCSFSPASFMLTMEKLLVDAGVDIWYDTRVCDTELSGRRVNGITVVNESGFGRMEAGCFIDASGTCVVGRRAGFSCLEEDNYMTVWAMEHGGSGGSIGDDLSIYNFTMNTFDEKSQILINEDTRRKYYDGMSDDELMKKCVFNGIDGAKLSRFVLESHRILRKRYEGADRNQCFPVKLPAMPQFRKIRCIKGDIVLEDGHQGEKFVDSVGLLGDWRCPGKVWEVPFRAMYPAEGTGGLLCAGRCVSSAGGAWEVTRVIPSAAMTGQVAGMAASLSIDRGVEVPGLDVKLLQDRLVEQGFVLHE